MSCHYSCASCSASIFMFKCLTCPSTRQLIDSTCICQSGYYQAQQPDCYLSQQADWITKSTLPIANVLYYTNIGLFWLYAIVIFCRVNSPKLRILINFGQILALLNYYPFIFDQISKQFIWSLSSFNFVYYFNFFTCQDSQVCKLFEYVWQPLLVLPSLVLCCLIAYFLINLCYRHSLNQTVSIGNYIGSNWFFIVFAFIDFTAVILSYNITKGILYSNWGFIFVGVYFVAIVLVLVKFFRIINNKQQSKIIHRCQYNWAYGYDQNYHMYFIDFLYQQAKLQSTKQINNNLTQTQNFNTTISAVAPQQQQQQPNKKRQQIKMFIPHSNLYIFEILMKLFFGSTTALLYEYKPTFIVFSLIILINIAMCWLGAFVYYDKFTLLLYFLMSIFVILCCSCYWVSIYWVVAVGVACIVTGFMIAVFVVLFFTNRKLNDKIVNKIFNVQAKQNLRSQKQNQSEQSSLQKKKQQQNEKQQVQPIKQEQNQQDSQLNLTTTKKQPFSGNLVKKSMPKALQSGQTNQIVQAPKNAEATQNILNAPVQEQNLLETLGKTNKKSKTIFKDMIKQKQDPQQQKNNFIRPSKHQTRLADVRSKMTAKNRTKNALQSLQPIQQQNNPNNTNNKTNRSNNIFDRNSNLNNYQQNLLNSEKAHNQSQQKLSTANKGIFNKNKQTKEME